VVAYLLYLNELLPEGAVLDRERLQGIAMPARDRFVLDNRRGGPEIR
jgi:cytochrome c